MKLVSTCLSATPLDKLPLLKLMVSKSSSLSAMILKFLAVNLLALFAVTQSLDEQCLEPGECIGGISVGDTFAER